MLVPVMKTPEKRVTLETIAESLGISRGTVDRAIHNRGRISEATKTLVLQRARELGYGDQRIDSLLSLRKKLHAALILPAEPAHFFHPVLQGALEMAASLQEPEIVLEIVQVDTDDGAEQEHRINMLPRETQGLILLPRAMDEPGRAVDRWRKRWQGEGKRWVLTVNSDLPGTGRDCFIGQDLYRSGKIAGELLGKMARFHKGAVLPLTGKKSLFGHAERIRGFLDFMGAFDPERTILPLQECFDDENRAEETVLHTLDKGSRSPEGGSAPPLAAIFCATGSATIGAGRALEKLGLSGRNKPVLIGYDRSEELIQLLYRSVVDALVSQDPHTQGAEAVKILHALARGNAPPPGKVHHTPTDIVLKELLYTEETPC